MIQLPATDQEAALIQLDALDQRERLLDLGFDRVDLRTPDAVPCGPDRRSLGEGVMSRTIETNPVRPWAPTTARRWWPRWIWASPRSPASS